MSVTIISVSLLALFGCSAALSSWQSAVLNKHNEVRSLVASGKAKSARGYLPRASNLGRMSWDSGIARNAQTWANKLGQSCNIAHSYMHGVGENVGFAGGWSSTKGVYDPRKPQDHVQAWYNEIKNYRGDVSKWQGSSKDGGGKKIGHFTQVIWATSTKLGCGYKLCSKGGIMVCQYSQPGNMVGGAIYKKR